MNLDPVTAESELQALSETVTGGLEIIAARALGDPEDVRDAVQETLARAVKAVREKRIPPDVSLAAFVYGIARHVITDVVRRRARERGSVHAPEQIPVSTPSALEILVHDEERDRLSRAMAQLSAQDRELLTRCFVDGERIVDLARRVHEPPERLRKRKSRALKRLREILRDTPSGHVSPDDPTIGR